MKTWAKIETRDAKRRRAWLGGALGLSPTLILLLVFFLYPVVQLLALAFFDPSGKVTLESYARVFNSTLYVGVLRNTFELSIWTALLSVILGYPIAYFLATIPERRRGKFLIWVLLPFWIGALIRTFSWIVILGRNGPINNVLVGTGLASAPLPLLFNLNSVLIGMTNALLPLAVLTMLPVMQSIPSDLVRAAGTLGARGGQAFWRIYFPLSMPGVAAAGLNVFITALGFFITPTLLGGPKDTTLPQLIIENIQLTLNWGLVSALSILLLVTALVVFVLYDRIFGIATVSGGSMGAAAANRRRPARLSGRAGYLLTAALGWMCDYAARVTMAWRRPRGRSERRPLLLGIVLLLLAFLSVPILFIVLISFTEQNFINWPPVGFTFRWYQRVFSSPLWLDAGIRSIVVALLTAAVSTIIGTASALVLVRRAFKGKMLIFLLVLMPAIVPRIIFAAAIFYLFARIGLVATTTGLVIGHTVIALPYVVITMMAVLKTYDENLDRAAATLGANSLRTLYHITLPIIWPGIISAMVFGFVVSLDELTIAMFTTAGLSATIPKLMWDEAVLQINPSLAAVSGLMLLVLTSAILLGELFRRRSLKT